MSTTGSNALPRETATKVVAEVAHSFFCAAKSLEAEEIGLGSVTLTLLPDEPRVQEEGKCLKALQELQDWGITILPAEYYQVCLAGVACLAIAVLSLGFASVVAFVLCGALLTSAQLPPAFLGNILRLSQLPFAIRHMRHACLCSLIHLTCCQVQDTKQHQNMLVLQFLQG